MYYSVTEGHIIQHILIFGKLYISISNFCACLHRINFSRVSKSTRKRVQKNSGVSNETEKDFEREKPVHLLYPIAYILHSTTLLSLFILNSV